MAFVDHCWSRRSYSPISLPGHESTGLAETINPALESQWKQRHKACTSCFPQSKDSHHFLYLCLINVTYYNLLPQLSAHKHLLLSSVMFCPNCSKSIAILTMARQPFSRTYPHHLILKSCYRAAFCKLCEATMIWYPPWLNGRRPRLFVLFFVQYQIFLSEKCNTHPPIQRDIHKIKLQVIRIAINVNEKPKYILRV